MNAWDYCGKEETRVEGPFDTGLPPARKNVKGDTAAFNQMVLEKGINACVDEGSINIGNVPKFTMGVNQYQANAMASTASNRSLLVDEWHVGPTGTGKSRDARAKNPGAFIKMHNKWWCGYAD